MLRPLGHPAHHDVVQPRRQPRTVRRGPRRIQRDVRVDHPDRRAAAERRRPGEQLEQHAGERVDVGPPVHGPVLEPLGRHVVERAEGGPGERQCGPARLPGGGAGDAEVDQVGELVLVVAAHEHVGRLDVAVHQPGRVRGVQRPRHLGQDPDRAARRHRALRLDHRGEVDAVDQPHVDEQRAVDLPEVVDRDDVRLGQLRGQRRLAAEAGLELRVARERGGQPLERDRAPAPGVPRAVDLAHAAPADEVLKPVRPELLGHGGSLRSCATLPSRVGNPPARIPWWGATSHRAEVKRCSPPTDRGGCAPRPRCAASSPRPTCGRASSCCRCSSARASTSRCRSGRCPASCSTPGRRCARRPPRPWPRASAG